MEFAKSKKFMQAIENLFIIKVQFSHNTSDRVATNFDKWLKIEDSTSQQIIIIY